MSLEESAYRLSSEILGHSADVRAVCYCPVKGPAAGADHVLLTASRDGTACVWQPEGGSARGYVLKKTVRKHTGYVSALCVLPENRMGKVMFATGGQDNTILVHSLEDDGQGPVECYSGHQGTISCIIYQHGNLISASWDSSVRVWRSGGECDVLSAHKPAVWAVAGLHAVDSTKRFLSGGADKMIRLWEVDTKMCIQEYRGHTDVVRDVKVASKDTFFSAANDCTIRKWSIHTGQCLSQLYGHEAFVYSLSLLPSSDEDELVSGGEDKTIRVWRGGVCAQVIPVPALSVWSVTCKANGDVVAGSSDGVARIFSCSRERQAAAEELKAYDDRVVQSRATSTDNAIDVSKLPGPEALSRPGRAKGDNLIINNNGKAEVYQWSEEEANWVLIGNALAKAPESGNIYNGKEYDFVFDIELDEGSPSMRKLKLPYNRSMDPYVAAEDFLSHNNLPAYYLDQVAEFITQNAGQYQGSLATTAADPFTGGSRYIPGSGGGGGGGGVTGGSDPFTGASRYRPGGGGGGGGAEFASGGGADPFTDGSSYRPSEFAHQQPEFNVSFKGGPASNSFFPMSGFKLFTSPQDYFDKVLSKVVEFNSSLQENVKFSDAQLQSLKELGVVLSSGSSQPDMSPLMLVEAMLTWPSQCVFPGLDLVRLMLCTAAGSAHFIGDLEKGRQFLNTLLEFTRDGCSPKNNVPVLRAVANFFAHEAGTQVVTGHRKWVLERLHRLFESTNRTHQIALSTVILNLSHYYTKHTEDAEGVKDCTEFIIKILSSSYDLEAKFRVLIGLGSMVASSKSVITSVMPLEDLCNMIQPLVSVEDPAKVGQCSRCVLQVLKR